MNSILLKWLEIEYYSTAKKAKFINHDLTPDKLLIHQSIRCLDYITSMNPDNYKNHVITIIALMWELVDKEQFDLRNIILKMLNRIGYSTSAIIIDSNYAQSGNKFFRPSSIFDFLILPLEQTKNEAEINKHSFLLTAFQKQIWEQLDSCKVVGVSAPTSAGKSFVILLKTISRMLEGDVDVVYIVPTLSLLNQVTNDYNVMLKKLNVSNVRIENGISPSSQTDSPSIHIITQEKALATFSNEDATFGKKLILVVDEVQNIERIQNPDDLRAKILFDVLIEFQERAQIDQIILSGPRVEGIDELGKHIFGNKALNLSTYVSPVLNLTYSISKERQRYYFNQYCPLVANKFSRLIETPSYIAGYGQKKYSSEYLQYLKSFVENVGQSNQNIIFAPTSGKAKDIAMAISGGQLCSTPNLDSLIDYYSTTVNANYALCNTLRSGIAYHHGKLPMHVRRTLEKAIAERIVSNVVCTTTLMQGVNMPAQNIIIRNPHLYVRKDQNASELSSYEMANLRGRAGRLLKDFVGRTFVLDESSFDGLEEYNQEDLFADTAIELPVGYGEKYQEYKGAIHDVLDNNTPVDSNMKQFGYLVSYIRQTTLRYGNAAQGKMSQAGISLTKEQVAAIAYKMESINVPKSVCYKNRYWDPLVLNEIYNECDIKNLPNSPTERGAKARLDEMLKFLRDNALTNAMYLRSIPPANQHGVGRSILCSLCMDWCCEKPLAQILSGSRYNGDQATEEIDNTIDLLQNTVSFKVPILIKPIFDILRPDSIFLLCMQAGAYMPLTRSMIEIGIPRETALYLGHVCFDDKQYKHLSDKDDIESIIRTVICQKFESLPYWIQVQLSFLT